MDPSGHATCDPSHWCGSAATNPAVSGWSVTGLTPEKAPAKSVAGRQRTGYAREDNDRGQHVGTRSSSDIQSSAAANAPKACDNIFCGVTNFAGDAWAHTGGGIVNNANDLKDWAWNHKGETLAIAAAAFVVALACVAACAEIATATMIVVTAGDLGLACAVGCTAAASMAIPAINLGATTWNAGHPDQQIDTAGLVGLPNLDPPVRPDTPVETTPRIIPRTLTDPFQISDAADFPEGLQGPSHLQTDWSTCYAYEC